MLNGTGPAPGRGCGRNKGGIFSRSRAAQAVVKMRHMQRKLQRGSKCVQQVQQAERVWPTRHTDYDTITGAQQSVALQGAAYSRVEVHPVIIPQSGGPQPLRGVECSGFYPVSVRTRVCKLLILPSSIQSIGRRTLVPFAFCFQWAYNALRHLLTLFHRDFVRPMTQLTTAPQRLMTIFAHPDDEVGVGGVLAQAAQAGAQVTLVCATRGEAATIYSPPEYGATPENLGEVRTRELECCRDALGAQQVLWLDWPDGGVAQVTREEAVAQVTALLRRWQPQIVITHPANGGYPHPDHIAVHEIVMAAWQTAADTEFRPDLGAAWAVSKLYARVMPQSIFDSVPGFADFRVQLNGAQLPFFAVPDDEISTIVDVTPWVDQRLAAWDCHRSQHNPEGMWRDISDEQRRANASRETLELLATRLPEEAVSLPETDIWTGIEAEIEAEAEPKTDDAATVARLVAALRGRRTYLEIYQKYRRFRPKPLVVELLTTLIDHTQDMIALLSSELRRLDYSPKQVGINEKLFEQATRRRNDAGKLTFLIVGSEKNLAWYIEQAAQGDSPAVQALWQELISFETADQQQIRQTLSHIETATGQIPGTH